MAKKWFLWGLVCLTCLVTPVFADQLGDDLKNLEKIVNTAYESLVLDPDLETAKVNNQQFLQTAELKMRFAEMSNGLHNFFDEDYLNLGLYLLALKVQRTGAALFILKRQLRKEKESRVKRYLNDRILALERVQKTSSAAKNMDELTTTKELNRFKNLFR